jgi:hypothetical protein
VLVYLVCAAAASCCCFLLLLHPAACCERINDSALHPLTNTCHACTFFLPYSTVQQLLHQSTCLPSCIFAALLLQALPLQALHLFPCYVLYVDTHLSYLSG